MNNQNTELLKSAFPNVFKSEFFFECGDGWFEIIAKIAAYINSLTEHCIAVQVKEKFGALRFYVSFDVDGHGEWMTKSEDMESIYQFITDMERTSRDICEDCGVELTVHSRYESPSIRGWFMNVCKRCADKYKQQT